MTEQLEKLRWRLINEKLNIEEENEVISKIKNIEHKMEKEFVNDIKIRIYEKYKHKMNTKKKRSSDVTDYQKANMKKEIIKRLKILEDKNYRLIQNRDKLNKKANNLWSEVKELKAKNEEYNKKTKYHKMTRNNLQKGLAVDDVNKDHNFHHEEVIKNHLMSQEYFEKKDAKYMEAKEIQNKANLKHEEFVKNLKIIEKIREELKNL